MMNKVKSIECADGMFVAIDRQSLEKGSRSTLKDYLEKRGYAVFASEKTAELREAALEDWDSA